MSYFVTQDSVTCVYKPSDKPEALENMIRYKLDELKNTIQNHYKFDEPASSHVSDESDTITFSPNFRRSDHRNRRAWKAWSNFDDE